MSYSSEYYRKNKEKIKASRKAYYERNKDKLLSDCKEYREQNREIIRKRSKDHSKRYYQKNKDAILERQRASYAADPDYDRRRTLKRKYGITLEQYKEALIQQEGVCKICEGESTGRGIFHVDHCHKTGKVRGLLCSKCNTGIGMLGDNPKLLMKAILYLEG